MVDFQVLDEQIKALDTLLGDKIAFYRGFTLFYAGRYYLRVERHYMPSVFWVGTTIEGVVNAILKSIEEDQPG